MEERVDRLMQDPEISEFLAKNGQVRIRVLEAASWLCNQHADVPDQEIIFALRRLLVPLRDEKLTVFFSYKARDLPVAVEVAKRLESWSAGKLRMEHMARFGVEEVGRNWRKKLEETIPRCDWFLLLLPERDRGWPLFEAGYFHRGQGLTGRLVCLHHSENELADALGATHSVPASQAAVMDFLTGLYLRPGWVPGLPPINPTLMNPEDKAREIVDLIQTPAQPGKKLCCGPHMEVVFENASRVTGWEELSLGSVVDSNKACLDLFGLEVSPERLGQWVGPKEGATGGRAWASELAEAVRAAAQGRTVPHVEGSFPLSNGRYVRPSICAVTRSQDDRALESVDILFAEVRSPFETGLMSPRLAALARTVEFSVRFRWEVLKHFSGRELEHKDVLAFNKALQTIEGVAVRDTQLSQEADLGQELTLSLFTGEEREELEKMYDRWAVLRRADGDGELDRALAGFETKTLEHLISELLQMNQRFLALTAARFADIIAKMPAAA